MANECRCRNVKIENVNLMRCIPIGSEQSRYRSVDSNCFFVSFLALVKSFFYFILMLQGNKNNGTHDCMDNNNGANGLFNDDNEDQGDMSFCMSNYARETMKMMFMMRSHHMLTDVVIEVQQELFHAHKVVLSAASPYFKAMFTGGLKESEMSRIKLQGVGISFISTLELQITFPS